MSNFEVILCIVNTGFAEAAMDTARKLGARGGTILNGRGTASKEAEKCLTLQFNLKKKSL